MRANYVKVQEIDFISIQNCEINQSVNAHGRAKVVGIIKDGDEEKCLNLASSETYIHIIAVSSLNKEKCIFTGIVENMEMELSDNKVVHLDLVTGSKLLDLVNRTRTFQNADMSYKGILKSNETLNKDIKAASIFLKSGDSMPGQLIAQYKETDWEFAIRIASHCNTCIIPSFKAEGSKYYFGINEGESAKKVENIMNLRVKKAVNEYEKVKKRKQLSNTEQDSYYYKFDSRELYEIGQCLDISVKKRLFVYKVVSKFDGQELVNTYILKTAKGFSKAKKYNETIIGASLDGKISGVTRDQVKLSLKTDNPYSDTGEMLFPYSTVYSSPDGTGWYCMPEIGDDVRLYFPTEDEANAYVISAVHLEVSHSPSTSSDSDYPPARTEPDYKSFKNSAGKEIIFAPHRLSIINPEHGKIELDDEKGIIISSEESIRFKADKVIEIHSLEDNVQVSGGNAVCIKQGNTKILLKDEEIALRGAKLKLQEKE